LWETSSHAIVVQLIFQDVNGGTLSTITGGGTVTTGLTAFNTTGTIAPAGAVTCQGVISHNITNDTLRVFYAGIQTDGSNLSQPPIVNQNYAFVSSYDPWTASNSALLAWNFSPLVTADGDFDSLVIDDVIELMGGQRGVESSIPELIDPVGGHGAIFRIHAPGGTVGVGSGPYDLGAPQPTSDVIESLLLDGERPWGERASNRTVTIPVMIFAPTLTTLAAARELLLQTIDQGTWKATWRPAESGLPLDLECFRASPSVVTYGFNYNRPAVAGSSNPAQWALSVVTLTFPALPYGKSGQDGTQTVNFLDGILDAGAVSPSVVMDDYSTVNASSPGGGTWVKNTAYFIASSQSARYSAPVPMSMPWAAAQYTKTGLNLNLTGMASIYLWFGQSYDTQWPVQKTFASNVTLSWTLTDVNGKTLSFSGKYNKCPWGADPNRPVWVKIAAAIPRGKTRTQFDYAHVTGYVVRVTNWAGSGATGYVRMHAWIARAIAVAPTTKWIATPHGSVYSVFGLNGMARSGISATIQLPSSNPVTQEISQSGTWTVPKGVTQVSAEAWGGGGGGGSVSGVSSGMAAGGGGGAEYVAESVVTTIAGTKIPVSIGGGGSGGQVVDRTVTFTRTGINTWTAPANVSVITAELWGGGAAGAAGGAGGGGGTYTKGTVNVTGLSTYRIVVGKGGVPNTGTLAKDSASRHGSDTVVSGDTGSLHAGGGKSPVTGGTPGGTGGTRFTVAESGTTITISTTGGNGGNSPGGAGGGGGASGGRTLTGPRGGDSPRGSNNYATGGPGAVSADGGGNGGKGADISGTPAKGALPGGGGGGGYTKAVNYIGAGGGGGKVIITYRENLGNPLNGGNTVFGQAGLTSKVLTAHGGSSSALNTATGGAGGTGSANTVHANGGVGAMSGNNADYLYDVPFNGGPFFGQRNQQLTGASVTTSAALTAHSTGLSIAVVTSSVALDSNVVVSDSAGNQYDFIAKADLPGSNVDHNLFVAKIGAPVTTATTLNVNNNGASVTATICWYGTVQYADVDTATLVTNSGTSTAPSVTVSNPDIGTHKGMFTSFMNNSTAALSFQPADPASFITSNGSTSSAFTAGTTVMQQYVKEVPGAGTTNSISQVIASSVAWTGISLPLIPQDVASPVPLRIGAVGTTGTALAQGLSSAFAVPPGRGYMMIVVEFASAPGTITFTDASGNTWTQRSTVAAGTGTLRVYTAPATTGYTTASTITLNDTTSQAILMTTYYVHEASAVDTSLDKTATGTSTAPAITTNASSGVNDLQFLVFANNNSVALTATPAGWVNFVDDFFSTMNYNQFAKRVAARNTSTVTGNFSLSQTWGVIALGFKSKVFMGSGGSSGGPLGPGNDGTDSGGSAWEGGGKGANALVSTTGNGQAAAVPGGGGSGAASTDTSSFVGGSGASGMVRLTWTPPLKAFNDLILHRPGNGAKDALCPVVTIPPNDPPDNREYPVPSLIAGKNAAFRGTYTVLAVANAWNSATTGTSRRVSVTVNQYEYPGGPAVSVQATKIVTPATDIVNGYVNMGELTLPVKDYDESDDEVYYTISIHDTDTGDSFQDILLLDTSGQTVLVNIAPGTAADSLYSSYFIDEPTFDKGLGQVLGSGHGRTRAISVLDMAMLTGGPLYLVSGENLLLAYSTGGAPNLGVTYNPRWYTDRIK
jgi:hypothetical protein